jgi:hypothetical protein
MDNNLNMETIEKSLEINYLTNLIKACEKNGLNKDLLEKKISLILEESETKANIIKNSNSSLSLNSSESPSTDQYNDEYLYLKLWTKLSAIHKIIKIKEYVNMLLIANDKDKDELKEKLIDMVKNKTITKKDTVLYDSIKGKIISIPNLQFLNGKYTFNL